MDPIEKSIYYDDRLPIPDQILEPSASLGQSVSAEKLHALKEKLEQNFHGRKLEMVTELMLTEALHQNTQLLKDFIDAVTENNRWIDFHQNLYRTLVGDLLTTEGKQTDLTCRIHTALQRLNLLQAKTSPFELQVGNETIVIEPKKHRLPDYVKAGIHFASGTGSRFAIADLSEETARWYRNYLSGNPELPDTPEELEAIYSLAYFTLDDCLMWNTGKAMVKHFSADSLLYDAYQKNKSFLMEHFLDRCENFDSLTMDQVKELAIWGLQDPKIGGQTLLYVANLNKSFLKLLRCTYVSDPVKTPPNEPLKTNFSALITQLKATGMGQKQIEENVTSLLHFRNITSALEAAIADSDPDLLRLAFKHVLSPDFPPLEDNVPPELSHWMLTTLERIGPMKVATAAGSLTALVFTLPPLIRAASNSIFPTLAASMTSALTLMGGVTIYARPPSEKLPIGHWMRDLTTRLGVEAIMDTSFQRSPLEQASFIMSRVVPDVRERESPEVQNRIQLAIGALLVLKELRHPTESLNMKRQFVLRHHAEIKKLKDDQIDAIERRLVDQLFGNSAPVSSPDPLVDKFIQLITDIIETERRTKF